MPDTQHVFQILEQDGVGIRRHRAVIQPRDRVVEQFQRTVGDGQLGGFFLHPRFQILIQLGEVLRHVVEGLAQPPDFVFPSQVGAHGKIALSNLVGQFQQAAQGMDQDVVDQIDGQDHHEQRGNDCCAEDDAHDQDFRFGGILDLLDQIIDAGDECGDLIQHRRMLWRSWGRRPADGSGRV